MSFNQNLNILELGFKYDENIILKTLVKHNLIKLNIGLGIYIEMSIPEAIEFLNKRTENSKIKLEYLVGKTSYLKSNIESIEKIINEYKDLEKFNIN